jgi:hypothetical protein
MCLYSCSDKLGDEDTDEEDPFAEASTWITWRAAVIDASTTDRRGLCRG